MRRKERGAEPLRTPEGISRPGRKVIAGGVAALLIGFAVLSRVDAQGRGWQAPAAAWLILGGYLLIGIGVILPEKLPTSGEVRKPSKQI